jgi:hypothetical protein
MPSTYAPVIAALDDKQKAHFYLLLARGLTVAQREVWADDQLDASEQIDRLKWLNEIMHRILNRLFDFQQTTQARNEDDLWTTIMDHVAQNRHIAGDLAWAVRDAYKIATQRDLPV